MESQDSNIYIAALILGSTIGLMLALFISFASLAAPAMVNFYYILEHSKELLTVIGTGAGGLMIVKWYFQD
jgi:hypothetical protein